MPRFACHRLYTPLRGGISLSMQTVELDAAGFFISYETLTKEVRQTEWLGGVCVLLPEGTIPQRGETVRELMARAVSEGEDRPLRLWKARGLSVGMADTVAISGWERVG